MQNKNYVENIRHQLAAIEEPVLLIQSDPDEGCSDLLAGRKVVRPKSSEAAAFDDIECKSVVYFSAGPPSRLVLKALSDGLTEGTPMLLSVAVPNGREIPAQTDVVTRLFESGFRLTALPGHAGHFSRMHSAVAAKTAATEQESAVIYSAATQAIRFRTYEMGDESQILAMFYSVFQVKRSLEHWNWKYRDNPLGGGMISLAESADGSLIGHYATYPLPMHVSRPGQSFTTIHGGDVMTSPAARRIGVGPTSVLTQMTTHFYNRFLCGNYSWGFGFNTGKKRVMGRRYTGYTYLPEVPFYNTAADKLRLEEGDTSNYHVRLVQQVTADFDELFDSVADDYRLLIERKSGYLDWRYLSCPDKKYFMYGVWKDDKLCGWGVFAKTMQGLFWGDALFQRDDAVLSTKSLLKHVNQVHELEDKLITAWFSPVPEWWTSVLVQLGFQRQPEPNALAPMVMRFDSRFSLEEIEREFYYTKGDGDLF